MRERIVRLSLCTGLLLVLSSTVVASAVPRNVILIDWDGTRRQQVDRSLAEEKLPVLQSLIDRGVYVKIDVENVTDTRAAWMQLLTGYAPKPAGDSDRQTPPAPKGTSILQRLEKHFGPEKFVTVALIGSHRTLSELPVAAASLPSQTQAAGVPSPAASPRANSPAPDVWEDDLVGNDEVGARAVELLEEYQDQPFFFFIRFARTADTEQDKNANDSTEALVSYDRWTGRIMDKIKQLGLTGRTQFYVTADRGLNEEKPERGFASHVFLATDNKAVYRDGRRQDIAPTILEAFGLGLGKIEPPLDGISLTKVDTRPPASGLDRKPDVVYVPTPMSVVNKMLELAQVKQSDVVYDLGCGDGRIPVTAAKRFGCRAFGYDIDPKRVAESLENVEKNGVGHLVTIEQRDIFTLDLSGADVVTLYLLPSLNVKLIPQLEKLKPGSRIVSHDFDMRGVKPDQVVEITGGNGTYINHTVYLWTCPLNKVDEPDEGDDGID